MIDGWRDEQIDERDREMDVFSHQKKHFFSSIAVTIY